MFIDTAKQYYKDRGLISDAAELDTDEIRAELEAMRLEHANFYKDREMFIDTAK